MLDIVDLLDVEVLDVSQRALLVAIPTQTGVRREISVPTGVIDEGPRKKGERGVLSVLRWWAESTGLI